MHWRHRRLIAGQKTLPSVHKTLVPLVALPKPKAIAVVRSQAFTPTIYLPHALKTSHKLMKAPVLTQSGRLPGPLAFGNVTHLSKHNVTLASKSKHTLTKYHTVTIKTNQPSKPHQTGHLSHTIIVKKTVTSTIPVASKYVLHTVTSTKRITGSPSRSLLHPGKAITGKPAAASPLQHPATRAHTISNSVHSGKQTVTKAASGYPKAGAALQQPRGHATSTRHVTVYATKHTGSTSGLRSFQAGPTRKQQQTQIFLGAAVPTAKHHVGTGKATGLKKMSSATASSKAAIVTASGIVSSLNDLVAKSGSRSMSALHSALAGVSALPLANRPAGHATGGDTAFPKGQLSRRPTTVTATVLLTATRVVTSMQYVPMTVTYTKEPSNLLAPSIRGHSPIRSAAETSLVPLSVTAITQPMALISHIPKVTKRPQNPLSMATLGPHIGVGKGQHLSQANSLSAFLSLETPTIHTKSTSLPPRQGPPISALRPKGAQASRTGLGMDGKLNMTPNQSLKMPWLHTPKVSVETSFVSTTVISIQQATVTVTAEAVNSVTQQTHGAEETAKVKNNPEDLLPEMPSSGVTSSLRPGGDYSLRPGGYYSLRPGDDYPIQPPQPRPSNEALSPQPQQGNPMYGGPYQYPYPYPYYQPEVQPVIITQTVVQPFIVTQFTPVFITQTVLVPQSLQLAPALPQQPLAQQQSPVAPIIIEAPPAQIIQAPAAAPVTVIIQNGYNVESQHLGAQVPEEVATITEKVMQNTVTVTQVSIITVESAQPVTVTEARPAAEPLTITMYKTISEDLNSSIQPQATSVASGRNLDKPPITGPSSTSGFQPASTL